MEADPPTDEDPTLLTRKEDVARLKGGKADDVSNITAELLKAAVEPMTCSLHSVLTRSD